MKIKTRIEVLGEPLQQGEVEDLFQMLKSSDELQAGEAKVYSPTQKIGTFASIDPNLLNLIINVGNVAALGIIFKGIFDIIIEWQKNRAQPINLEVGEVSLIIPPYASQDEILDLARELSIISKSLQEEVSVDKPEQKENIIK